MVKELTRKEQHIADDLGSSGPQGSPAGWRPLSGLPSLLELLSGPSEGRIGTLGLDRHP